MISWESRLKGNKMVPWNGYNQKLIQSILKDLGVVDVKTNKQPTTRISLSLMLYLEMSTRLDVHL